MRESLAGRDYICPVRPDTRMACISLRRVVDAFIRMSELPGNVIGSSRTVLLTGIPVSAQQMWDAVKGKATGKVRFQPDPAVQAIMDRIPKATCSERAQRLGLRPSVDIEEILRDYEEATLTHHG